MTTPTQAELDAFRELCKRHDLTYDYSDDGETYRRGSAQKDVIRIRAREIGMEHAVPIWNEIVDTKLLEGYREPFYWKLP